MKKGALIISLDFELHWGAVEKWDLSQASVQKYFKTTRESIPKVLELFNKFSIHATWATVGFLFSKNKEQLEKFSPTLKPTYLKECLSYYKIFDTGVGNNEKEDPFHYAGTLIDKIISTPNQELATHTFAHYYCKEKGQTIMQFDEDLKAAQNIAKENYGVKLESLVFPRNQFNLDYLKIAKKNGIRVVRSNPNVWFWRRQNKLTPIVRAFDTLMSVSRRRLSFKLSEDNYKQGVLLLPASRFLRPYISKEKVIQKVKINRIKKEMTYAAKNNEFYHLWWHPHNFGNSMETNLFFLEEILIHYQYLNKKYNFTSITMKGCIEK